MFGFLSGIPSRLRHILSRFGRYFTRPRYENFCRVTLELMTAGEEEHDVKNVNEYFHRYGYSPILLNDANVRV